MQKLKINKNPLIRLLTLVPIAILIVLMVVSTVPETIADVNPGAGSTKPEIGYDWFWQAFHRIYEREDMTHDRFFALVTNSANFVIPTKPKNSPTKHLQNSQNKATLSATYFSTTTKNFQWD